jgi:hypothetical protein
MSYFTDVPQIVTSINKADVLLGRGKQVHAWEGNIAFRKLCAEAATSYLLAIERNAKDDIISKLITHLNSEGGRFLHQKEFMLPDGTRQTVWITVPSLVVRRKVKQACRDALRIRARGCRVSITTILREKALCPGHVQTQAVQHSVDQTSSDTGQTPQEGEVRQEVEVLQEDPKYTSATPNDPNDAELMEALLSMYGTYSSASRDPTDRHLQLLHQGEDEPSLSVRYHGGMNHLPPPQITADPTFTFNNENPYHGLANHPIFALNSGLRRSQDHLINSSFRYTASQWEDLANMEPMDDNVSLLTLTPAEKRQLAADPLARFIFHPHNETMFRC